MIARRLAPVALCALLLLAGCAGTSIDRPPVPTPDTGPGDGDAALEPPDLPPTTPQTDDVRVSVRANGSYTVTATAVTDPTDGVRVHYVDGTARVYDDVRSPSELPTAALDGASRVEPVAGESGASLTTDAGGSVGWPATASTVIYSAADADGRLLRWDVVDCGDGRVNVVEIEIAEDGIVAATHGCVR